MSEQIVESRQWEIYAKENRELEETPTKVEVEIWHNGVPDLFFSKLRRIGSTRQAETGMIVETWEPVIERDIPQTFTVMLHEGTLESHIRMCKYRETDHGARLIQKLGYVALLLIYIPLLSSLGGLIPSDVDLLSWYWFGPICAVAGMFTAMWFYNQASTCGRIVLECAEPMLEEGGNHLCYIVQSKTANVVQQLNAMDRFEKWLPALIAGHNKNLGARRAADRDRIARLEWELNQDRKDIRHEATQDIQRKLALGHTPVRREGISLAHAATAMVLVAMAVALLVYYGM